VEVPYIPVSQPAKGTPKNYLKIPLAAAAASFLLVLVVFGFNVVRFKQDATDSAPEIYNLFKQGASALLNFELPAAKQAFETASQELKDLNEKAPIKTLPKILENLFKLSQSAASLSGTLEELKTQGLALLINKKGAFLIEHFKNARDRLKEINSLSANLKSQAAAFGYQAGNEFLEGPVDFLDALIAWLEAPKKQRLLVFFQNPSEIRPAGGFIGSYGNATLFQGNLLEIEVRDIYDPDGQLELKVIPPKPLQGITDKWGARDANWFFDFPTSAQKVISFLEASKIYSERGIKFSGAVAINVEVIKDILEVIGPIELADYQLTINSENFLREVQREVEAGDDKAKGEPKKILKALTPTIFERLANLRDKESLVKKLTARLNQKDIMVYFKEKTIQSYLEKLGVAGDVYSLPENFSGDYLAVVNANIAGGKSDAMISQAIKLESKINQLGEISHHLVVERTHKGKDEKEWWYRATNKNYLQIFTTPGSELEKIAGRTEKTIKPLIDYRGENYSSDATLSDFGKTVFAAWFDVKAGESRKLKIDYASPKRINLAGGSYQLIFEKQSGVNGRFEFSIEAPDGYQWQESQSKIFTYSIQDPPARTSLNLTLAPAPK
jgi:hypothetical protein